MTIAEDIKRILILNDDTQFVDLLTDHLNEEFSIEAYDSIVSYINNFSENSVDPDIVITKNLIKDGSTKYIITDLKRKNLSLPIICLMKEPCNKRMSEFMANGVSDFFLTESQSISDLVIKIKILRGLN